MKLFSVVIIYHPNKVVLSKLVRLLLKQCEKVIIVNNGEAIVDTFDHISPDKINDVVVINNSDNFGIATAQNIGIKCATDHGATHIVFFDQDSVIEYDTVSRLFTRFLQLSKIDKIAALGPIYIDEKKGFTYPVIQLNKFGCRNRILPIKNNDVIPVSFIISSGSITSITVINEVGGMLDQFFIDYVDTEWCLRAKSKGYSFFVDTDICMKHSIGDSSIRVLKWNFPVHSPFRRYYRIRNAYLMFRLKHIPFVLKLREVIINFCHQIIIFLYTEHKKKQAITWWLATKDGLKIVFFGR